MMVIELKTLYKHIGQLVSFAMDVPISCVFKDGDVKKVRVKPFLDAYLVGVISQNSLNQIPIETKEKFSRKMISGLKKWDYYGGELELSTIQEGLVALGYNLKIKSY